MGRRNRKNKTRNPNLVGTATQEARQAQWRLELVNDPTTSSTARDLLLTAIVQNWD